MLDDAHGEDLRLGGDDESAIAERSERAYGAGSVGVQRVLEQADGAEAVAIERERPVQDRAVRGVQQAGETAPQRRAQTPLPSGRPPGRPARPPPPAPGGTR